MFLVKNKGIIIQARMGSTRLPGKVLNDVLPNVTMLEFMVDRVQKSACADIIIVATTIENNDDPIYNMCESRNIECFRGSENDVLKRYYDCATKYGLDTIIRLTADCPLVDPNVIDRCIGMYTHGDFDYVSNTCPPAISVYPDGSDVEVFSYYVLKLAHAEATLKSDREHVTFYFWKNEDTRFKTGTLESINDYSKYRYTVDYPKDLDVVLFIISEIKKMKISGTISEIAEILDNNPDIKNLNSSYYPGIGWEK